MAVLRHGPVRIEAGIEYSDVLDDATLKGRLLARYVDYIECGADSPAAEVLELARALAADTGPIPQSVLTRVELVTIPGMARVSDAVAAPPTPPSAGRQRTMSGPVGNAEQLAAALERAITTGFWMEAVHAAQALIRLTPQFPEHEQRAHLLALRRAFTRPILEQFIAFAMRATEEQARVAEILSYGGPEAIELMVDQVRGGEVIGPRKFLYDVLVATPASLPLLLPLLESPVWYEVRHAADLVSRLGAAEAIDPLRRALKHPDPRVRQAVVEALGRFPGKEVVEPIRRTLGDPDPGPRASAAFALAQRHSPGLALPILVALESEKDPDAWNALVEALARIDSPEAVSSLAGMALGKRSLLRPGRSMGQRLEIIRALARAGTPGARGALERIAAEGTAQIQSAAAAALQDPQR